MRVFKRRKILVIVLIVGIVAGFAEAVHSIWHKMQQEINSQKALASKNSKLFSIMSEWMKTKRSNRTVADYLSEKGYRTIGVYGMGNMGDCLIGELNNSPVVVKYAIDRNAEDIYANVNLYKPNDDLPDADAIVVTVLTESDSIKNELQNKMKCPILSIEDIIMDM